jgi:hypothetical protein
VRSGRCGRSAAEVRSSRGGAGTASDDAGVERVAIALLRVRGSARAARPTCWALTARGTLERVQPRRRRCQPRGFLAAKGTNRWSFTLERRLPKGRYVLYSRATDYAGLSETTFTPGRNRVRFRLR